ncbi:WRKY transcription factor 55 [Acorus calamus]|uniref:WRKY transcription factor 55 n=1 Tax=Acorus calamus TaxID=4465 RepID=A0AAV9C3C9_ACOCL|nr:WRKY transcription factor 55 [Acorus calamus]
MEENQETMSLILHGCALAQDLESNIAGYAGQPELLLASCDRISDVFRQASNRLRSPPPPLPPIGDVTLFEAPDYAGPTTVGGTDFEAAGPSVQRAATRRKKKDSCGRYTERVPAPALRAGGADIPPDDGYTWRKYGQKDILGSRFPRNYYRCTHKNYGCGAKKYVQRLDEDPSMYEVTYRDPHTCQTSPTPIVILPGPSDFGPPVVPLSTTIGLGSWFSGSLDVGRAIDEGGRSVGSASQHVGDVDCPVADLADVMFNSVSGRSSMEGIFAPKDD